MTIHSQLFILDATHPDMFSATVETPPDAGDVIAALATGKFHRPIGAAVTVPTACVDGRLPALLADHSLTEAPELEVNAAGATISLAVAKDLTWAANDASQSRPSTAEMAGATVAGALAAGLPVGFHTDDHMTTKATGCGANDNWAKSYAVIREHAAGFRHFLQEQLNWQVPLQAHELIVRNASRTEFSASIDVLEAMHLACQDAEARQVHEVELCRGHHEVTMTFESATRELLGAGADAKHVAAATAAMAYYNLAVLVALGVPGTVGLVLMS